MATQGQGRRHSAGIFDIRLIIALLFFLYGVVLTIMGLMATPEELAKSTGLNINLWGGVGMLVFAVVIAGWARLRPIVIPEE